jgi:ribosomal protein L28
MGKKCDLCQRVATKGASRSHSKIKTLKRQGINLQSKTIDGMKLKLCTSCLRTLDKPKRVKTPRKPALKKEELEALAKKKAAIRAKKAKPAVKKAKAPAKK